MRTRGMGNNFQGVQGSVQMVRTGRSPIIQLGVCTCPESPPSLVSQLFSTKQYVSKPATRWSDLISVIKAGMGAPALALLFQKICCWAEVNLFLSAIYFQGKENVNVDILSRTFLFSMSLCLCPLLFQNITEKFSLSWLYLFAAEENTLLPHFSSLGPSRKAWLKVTLVIFLASIGFPRG